MAPPARKTKHKGNIRHQDQVGPGVYLVLVPDTYPFDRCLNLTICCWYLIPDILIGSRKILSCFPQFTLQ